MFRADAFGSPFPQFDAQLRGTAQAPAGATRTEGRCQRALRLDGGSFVKAAFPGMSRSLPHTVLFWVRVQPDAQLSAAYAMVAWGLNFKEFGVHPVHICWNSNPLEGPVGALRTDFLGGHTIGSTLLRDGRWHHVAVVFVPSGDPDTLAQVKLYVDGRLETSTATRGVRREIFADFSQENPTTVSDTIWLGCRLGSNRERRGRFCRELDELVIADRALRPEEIVQLMRDNKPEPTAMAALQQHD